MTEHDKITDEIVALIGEVAANGSLAGYAQMRARLLLRPPQQPAKDEAVGDELEALERNLVDAMNAIHRLDQSRARWADRAIRMRRVSRLSANSDAVEALRHIVKVLGPNVPDSVTDQGARWEWVDALATAQAALSAKPEQGGE